MLLGCPVGLAACGGSLHKHIASGEQNKLLSAEDVMVVREAELCTSASGELHSLPGLHSVLREQMLYTARASG